MTNEIRTQIRERFESLVGKFTNVETDVDLPEFVKTKFKYHIDGCGKRDTYKISSDLTDYEKANNFHHDNFYVTCNYDGVPCYLIRVDYYNKFYKVYNKTGLVFFEEMGWVTDDRTQGIRVISYTKEYREKYGKTYSTVVISDEEIAKYYSDGRIEKEKLY